eukprot:767157-Hanusia_phi.AAC.7
MVETAMVKELSPNLSDKKFYTVSAAVDVIGSAANLAKSQHRFGSQSADRSLSLALPIGH